MASDGDHYRLQYNWTGSWSLKYNMGWQKMLGLRTFPSHVFSLESTYYQKQMGRCGVPLDNRGRVTKTDSSLWSATLGSDVQFEEFVKKLYIYANSTALRVPFADIYDVDTCKPWSVRARPVQGGLYARMLPKSRQMD